MSFGQFGPSLSDLVGFVYLDSTGIGFAESTSDLDATINRCFLAILSRIQMSTSQYIHTINLFIHWGWGHRSPFRHFIRMVDASDPGDRVLSHVAQSLKDTGLNGPQDTSDKWPHRWINKYIIASSPTTAFASTRPL